MMIFMDFQFFFKRGTPVFYSVCETNPDAYAMLCSSAPCVFDRKSKPKQAKSKQKQAKPKQKQAKANVYKPLCLCYAMLCSSAPCVFERGI